MFQKYSQMKLQMKREALQKLNRNANGFCHGQGELMGFCHGFATVGAILVRFWVPGQCQKYGKWFKIKEASNVGA